MIQLNDIELYHGKISNATLTNGIVSGGVCSKGISHNKIFTSPLVSEAFIINVKIGNLNFCERVVTDGIVINGKVSKVTISNGAIHRTAITDATVTFNDENFTIFGNILEKVVIKHAVIVDVRVAKLSVTGGIITRAIFTDGTLTNGTIVNENVILDTLHTKILTLHNESISNFKFLRVKLTNVKYGRTLLKSSKFTSGKVHEINLLNITLRHLINLTKFNDVIIVRQKLANGSDELMMAQTLTFGSISFIRNETINSLIIKNMSINGMPINNGILVKGVVVNATITDDSMVKGTLNGNVYESVIIFEAIVNGNMTTLTLTNATIVNVFLKDVKVDTEYIHTGLVQGGELDLKIPRPCVQIDNINLANLTVGNVTLTNVVMKNITTDYTIFHKLDQNSIVITMVSFEKFSATLKSHFSSTDVTFKYSVGNNTTIGLGVAHSVSFDQLNFIQSSPTPLTLLKPLATNEIREILQSFSKVNGSNYSLNKMVYRYLISPTITEIDSTPNKHSKPSSAISLADTYTSTITMSIPTFFLVHHTHSDFDDNVNDSLSNVFASKELYVTISNLLIDNATSVSTAVLTFFDNITTDCLTSMLMNNVTESSTLINNVAESSMLVSDVTDSSTSENLSLTTSVYSETDIFLFTAMNVSVTELKSEKTELMVLKSDNIENGSSEPNKTSKATRSENQMFIPTRTLIINILTVTVSIPNITSDEDQDNNETTLSVDTSLIRNTTTNYELNSSILSENYVPVTESDISVDNVMSSKQSVTIFTWLDVTPTTSSLHVSLVSSTQPDISRNIIVDNNTGNLTSENKKTSLKGILLSLYETLKAIKLDPSATRNLQNAFYQKPIENISASNYSIQFHHLTVSNLTWNNVSMADAAFCNVIFGNVTLIKQINNQPNLDNVKIGTLTLKKVDIINNTVVNFPNIDLIFAGLTIRLNTQSFMRYSRFTYKNRTIDKTKSIDSISIRTLKIEFLKIANTTYNNVTLHDVIIYNVFLNQRGPTVLSLGNINQKKLVVSNGKIGKNRFTLLSPTKVQISNVTVIFSSKSNIAYKRMSQVDDKRRRLRKKNRKTTFNKIVTCKHFGNRGVLDNLGFKIFVSDQGAMLKDKKLDVNQLFSNNSARFSIVGNELVLNFALNTNTTLSKSLKTLLGNFSQWSKAPDSEIKGTIQVKNLFVRNLTVGDSSFGNVSMVNVEISDVSFNKSFYNATALGNISIGDLIVEGGNLINFTIKHFPNMSVVLDYIRVTFNSNSTMKFDDFILSTEAPNFEKTDHFDSWMNSLSMELENIFKQSDDFNVSSILNYDDEVQSSEPSRATTENVAEYISGIPINSRVNKDITDDRCNCSTKSQKINFGKIIKTKTTDYKVTGSGRKSASETFRKSDVNNAYNRIDLSRTKNLTSFKNIAQIIPVNKSSGRIPNYRIDFTKRPFNRHGPIPLYKANETFPIKSLNYNSRQKSRDHTYSLHVNVRWSCPTFNPDYYDEYCKCENLTAMNITPTSFTYITNMECLDISLMHHPTSMSPLCPSASTSECSSPTTSEYNDKHKDCYTKIVHICRNSTAFKTSSVPCECVIKNYQHADLSHSRENIFDESCRTTRRSSCRTFSWPYIIESLCLTTMYPWLPTTAAYPTVTICKTITQSCMTFTMPCAASLPWIITTACLPLTNCEIIRPPCVAETLRYAITTLCPTITPWTTITVASVGDTSQNPTALSTCMMEWNPYLTTPPCIDNMLLETVLYCQPKMLVAKAITMRCLTATPYKIRATCKITTLLTSLTKETPKSANQSSVSATLCTVTLLTYTTLNNLSVSITTPGLITNASSTLTHFSTTPFNTTTSSTATGPTSTKPTTTHTTNTTTRVTNTSYTTNTTTRVTNTSYTTIATKYITNTSYTKNATTYITAATPTRNTTLRTNTTNKNETSQCNVTTTPFVIPVWPSKETSFFSNTTSILCRVTTTPFHKPTVPTTIPKQLFINTTTILCRVTTTSFQKAAVVTGQKSTVVTGQKSTVVKVKMTCVTITVPYAPSTPSPTCISSNCYSVKITCVSVTFRPTYDKEKWMSTRLETITTCKLVNKSGGTREIRDAKVKDIIAFPFFKNFSDATTDYFNLSMPDYTEKPMSSDMFNPFLLHLLNIFQKDQSKIRYTRNTYRKNCSHRLSLIAARFDLIALWFTMVLTVT
ncbi:hypothetical protein CHUAL_013734 [Chamberlinius hualienensis]